MHNDSPDQASTDAIDVLLVEDNPGDIRLTRKAFETTSREVALQTVTDGDAAVDFLQQSPGDSLPDIVLLDLNVPGRNGCEVLEAIRSDPRLNPLPVIMLTSSEADEDVVRSYEARANAYLTKPTAPAEYVSLVRSIERFWIEQAQLPPISQ